MAGRILIACTLLLATAGELEAKEVGGVDLPEVLRVDPHELVLNGAGLRKKFFIKVYAGALYLTEKNSQAGEIIDADEPMAIRLHFIYDGVSAEDLVKAWNEGFDAATGGDPGPLEEKIKAFNTLFVQPAQKGDVYD
ncbi:MAG: chalcone isomerase family protein, partial [Desulfobacteraceae bacterium]